MILVKPSHTLISVMYQDYGSSPLSLIELAGRTCYKSEAKITEESSEKFCKQILERGHESVIEHSAITVRFICDRGVSHELVRHRICAFSQESTRYVNYKGGCTFIIPPWLDIPEGKRLVCEGFTGDELYWIIVMLDLEQNYTHLIDAGWSPQQARSVLPNSTKTEIVVTANFREWRHIFKLRTAKAAHPQMREIIIPLLKEVKSLIPVIFDDLEEE